MSTSFFFSIGFLISFLLFISSSAIYRPVSAVLHQKRNTPYYDNDNNNDENDIQLMVYPKYLSLHRLQRSFAYHPRTSRNSWFRASTYQHMKPNGASEEKSSGDNLMRWG